jgi:mannan endo-1,4-beta-mannosidase
VASSSTRARTGALGLAVALLLAALAIQPPAALAAPAPNACTPDPVLCPERLYVGVSLPGLPSNPAAVDPFTKAVGVSPSVAMFFAGFGNRIDAAALQRLRAAQRLPMVTWEPYLHTSPSANPYPLRSIAAGQFDGYLRTQAAALAAAGGPVAVRFAHEMNGAWYPWGAGTNGNTAADYVAAYRHVHDVVTAAGATNVIWVWSPNLVGTRTTPDLGPHYPGDDYVDWVGLSAYLDETTQVHTGQFSTTLGQLDRVAPSKPIYVAETAVLPGPTRPAMIREMMARYLAAPRLIGFTWFDFASRFDWRIENDPAAAAALAGVLVSPHFGSAGHVTDPVVAPPVRQVLPMISGTAHVGRALAASMGSWRSAAGSGEVVLASRWYRCTDSTTTASCTDASVAGTGYAPVPADLTSFLRVAVTATNDAGSSVAWSAPTQAVLMTPQTPAAPTVESRDGALRVQFPAVVPAGATHWRLTIAGTVKPLTPVSTREYWLPGLTNATGYQLTLTAVSASATEQLSSPSTSGVGVPMTAPYNPNLRLAGTTGTVTLPTQRPAGATGWVLTVGATTQRLPISAITTQVTGLTPGRAVPWTLRAVAGSWAGQPGASATPPASGTLPVPSLTAPAPPGIEARDTALRVTFPAAPAGATHWRLTVNGTAKQLIPVPTRDYWLTGLTNGTDVRLSLAGAVAASTSSVSGPTTSGVGVALAAPWKPFVAVSGTTATVKLPKGPAGATGWRLTVGSVTRDLPLTTTTTQVTGLPRGQATAWSLRAVAGSWSNRSGTSVTPAVSGTVTAR